jgi:hypothetical protein
MVVGIAVGPSTDETTGSSLTNEQAHTRIRSNMEIAPLKELVTFKKNLMIIDRFAVR